MTNNPTISLAANGKLLLTFEGNLGFAHSVAIPNSIEGLRLINAILSARNEGKAKLGQQGNPTQEMIKLWLANKLETDRLTAREELFNDFE